MNAAHLRAFLWLHWRLRVNQVHKGGMLNAIFLGILATGGVLLALALFVIFLLIGMWALADAEPAALMYVWDGIVVGFLMMWLVGLVTDLQRSEALSLDRFLHLPVSLSGVFVLNYLSSLLSLTLIVFAPAMLGLCLGLILGRGAEMLLLVPLLAAFLVMVTALTYQFKGWLASLMVNKRRRRTIIVVVTAVFILVFQLPNLLNIMRPWDRKNADNPRFEELAELDRAVAAREITAAEHARLQQEALKRMQADTAARHRQVREQVEDIARIANLVLPPGWLPWGAAAAAEGRPHLTLLAMTGMALIGGASLRRAYRTTLRLYTGAFTAGRGQPSAAAIPASPPAPAAAASAGLLDRQLPWISERAAAIALSSFRALTRAPEVKMLLLSPIVMVAIFGGIFLRRESAPPVEMRPLMVAGAMAMVLLTLIQLVGNQFGFDRGGFRVFVLCPARRRDILLGKNLAVAPLALALGLAGAALVQAVYPLRLDHFLAVFPQMISMYLLFCLVANCLSIMAPMPIAAGSLRPANTRVLVIVLHFAFMLVFPILLALTLAPYGVEAVLAAAQIVDGAPINLALSAAMCVGVAYFYRWLIGWQGVWLQSREQRILEIVTTKAE